MAKQLEEIIKSPIEFPFIYSNPDIQYCPCGCGPLIRHRHRYMESKVTGEWYCDIVCAVSAEKAKWVGDKILDDGVLYTKDQWMQDREITDHG